MGFKNTLKCCRVSGNVNNYKALQRVAGEPAVLQTHSPTGSHFFPIRIHITLLNSFDKFIIIVKPI